MQLPLLFKTASFRLATAYALLFGVSVAILAGVIYFAATSALDRQIRTRIFAESTALATEYHSGGFGRLMSAVHERQRGHLSGGLDYSVFGAGGKRLYGTMTGLHFTPGWQTIYGPPDGDEPPGQMENLSVYATRLAGKPLIVRVPGDYAWEQATQRFGVQDSIEEFQTKYYAVRVEILR